MGFTTKLLSQNGNSTLRWHFFGGSSQDVVVTEYVSGTSLITIEKIEQLNKLYYVTLTVIGPTAVSFKFTGGKV